MNSDTGSICNESVTHVAFQIIQRVVQTEFMCHTDEKKMLSWKLFVGVFGGEVVCFQRVKTIALLVEEFGILINALDVHQQVAMECRYVNIFRFLQFEDKFQCDFFWVGGGMLVLAFH